MALFDIATLTPAQRAANEVRRIANLQFQQLGQSGKQGFLLIWNNMTASPADILAALGTDAETIFPLAQLNISTLEEAAYLAKQPAPQVPALPDMFQLRFDADGNAILTNATDEESSSSHEGN